MLQDTRTRGLAHVHQQYRPDIDGLRAVAVLAVVLSHAGFTRFSGGFIGVDIFFLISGFVVTNSILGDLERGEFSLRAFYGRRALRLAPALCIVLVSTFAFGLLFLFPEDVFKLAKNIFAVATMTSNIYLSKQTGYFDPGAAEQPLLHTWSLSVEEQFYLVLPVILYMLRGKAAVVRGAVLAACGLLSFSLAILAHWKGQPGAYYFAHFRAFEFIGGVLLAVAEWKRVAVRSAIFDTVFVAGAATIVVGVMGASREDQFPGFGALLPCAAAAAIIFAGRRACLVHHTLGNSFCSYLGRISYPLYLWHWPILFAMRRLDFMGPIADGAGLVLLVVISSATHRVELAVKRRRWGTASALRRFALLPLLGAATVAGVGKLTDGFLFAYPRTIQDNVKWSGTALFDMPRAKQCWSQVGISSARACTVGDALASRRAILWGDSHAYHLVHFFDELGKDRGIAVHDVAFTLCPPIETMSERATDPAFDEQHRQCAEHNRNVMNYAVSRPDIQIVFMSAAWQNYQNLARGADVKPNLHGFMPMQLESELAATVAKLEAAGKRVVLLDDVPMVPNSLINCGFYNGLLIPYPKRECRFDRSIAVEQHAPIAAMQSRLQARFPDIQIMHTYDVPCDRASCRLDFDGLPIYRYSDYHHLGLAGSMKYYGEYRRKHPGELEAMGL
ncbi:acyltransferase family protein [Burkholderia sp. BDU5]|uniref:acyltransferase family protein n=1 Tax=Burkholderia sp. BDU5 TaxID=1385590 RepID=UPI0007547B3C|nr:acyltransferase family protein [Burkholderia sp. BDU5]KVE34449.1 hypothetical protein WS69_17065 [Burkholderia sp. BDU5]